jgi:hypothetical protein
MIHLTQELPVMFEKVSARPGFPDQLSGSAFGGVKRAMRAHRMVAA